MNCGCVTVCVYIRMEMYTFIISVYSEVRNMLKVVLYSVQLVDEVVMHFRWLISLSGVAFLLTIWVLPVSFHGVVSCFSFYPNYSIRN